MFRFYYVVIISIFHEIYYLLRMNHIIRNKEHYSPEHRYAIVRNVVRFIKINGCIFTKSYGTENLPQEGGYIMFPNHQGKYDACGIMYTHKKRCSFVIDKKKSNMPILKQILALSDSLPMEIDNVRQSIGVIKEVADRVKNGVSIYYRGKTIGNFYRVYDENGVFIALTQADIIDERECLRLIKGFYK